MGVSALCWLSTVIVLFLKRDDIPAVYAENVNPHSTRTILKRATIKRVALCVRSHCCRLCWFKITTAKTQLAELSCSPAKEINMASEGRLHMAQSTRSSPQYWICQQRLNVLQINNVLLLLCQSSQSSEEFTVCGRLVRTSKKHPMADLHPAERGHSHRRSISTAREPVCAQYCTFNWKMCCVWKGPSPTAEMLLGAWTGINAPNRTPIHISSSQVRRRPLSGTGSTCWYLQTKRKQHEEGTVEESTLILLLSKLAPWCENTKQNNSLFLFFKGTHAE